MNLDVVNQSADGVLHPSIAEAQRFSSFQADLVRKQVRTGPVFLFMVSLPSGITSRALVLLSPGKQETLTSEALIKINYRQLQNR